MCGGNKISTQSDFWNGIRLLRFFNPINPDLEVKVDRIDKSLGFENKKLGFENKKVSLVRCTILGCLKKKKGAKKKSGGILGFCASKII